VSFLLGADAGKSTIGGQIMKLTGMVDERTLERYEKEAKEANRESWYGAFGIGLAAIDADPGGMSWCL
jgi:peptide chain release factor subunit 3